MKPLLESSSNVRFPHVEQSPDFHLAVIFDLPSNGLLAMSLCQTVINRFNDDFLFHLAMCPLGTFDGSGTKTVAQRQAERASVIILATATPPPPPFWKWLDAWACVQAAQSAAIVALATGGTEIDDRLRHLCSYRDIDLIIQSPGSGGVEPPPPVSKGASHEGTQLATTVPKANTHPVQDACLIPEL